MKKKNIGKKRNLTPRPLQPKLKLKTKTKNNYKIKKFQDKDFVNKMISKTLLAQAQVDKDNIRFFSSHIDRKVKQEKEDNRHYNINFIRKNDELTLVLMDCGIRSDYKSGDSIEWQSAEENIKRGCFYLSDRILSLLKSEASYVAFPFCSDVSGEIRSRYLLKTEHTDTYESIKLEIDARAYDFCSKEEWKVISESMKEGIERIRKEDVIFLNPLDEDKVTNLRLLTEEEIKKYHLTIEDKNKNGLEMTPIKERWIKEGQYLPIKESADFRKDTHDLVSLKMLELAMKGEDVDPLNPFAGAFSKYMPELEKRGVRSVIFEVIDNKLTKIKLNFNKNMKDVPFSAVKAGISLVEEFGKNVTERLSENTRYYVCTGGYVSHPGEHHWGYVEALPLNDKVVPAAETILFSKKNDFPGPLATRLYFYPYKPSQLNPMYQHMSVIYGLSDQALHSCADDPNREYMTEEYKSTLAERIRSEFIDREPAIKAVRHFFMHETCPPEAMAEDKEYSRVCREASDSHYAENIDTVRKYTEIARTKNGFPNESAEQLLASKLLSNYLPLFSRFSFYNYLLRRNYGITAAAQATSWRMLRLYDVEEVQAYILSDLEFIKAFNDDKLAIARGMDFIESFEKHIAPVLAKKAALDKKYNR